MPTLLDLGDGSVLSLDGSGSIALPTIFTKKVTLGFPNYVEEATFSGAGWNPLFPLSNLKDPVYGVKARSLSLSVDPIQFTFAKRRRIGGLLLPRHNCTNAARFRVELFYGTDYTDLQWDSDWQFVWPQIYAIEDLDWEDDNYWTRNIRNEDRALYSSLAVAIADTNYLVGSGRLYIEDAYNPAGVFNIGRMVLPTIWQPKTNMDFDPEFGSLIDTGFSVALDGTEYPDAKKRKRTFGFVLGDLSREEAFTKMQRAYQTQGIHREVFVCDDLTVDKTFMDRAFVGRFTTPNAISNPYLSTYRGAVALQEFI